MKTMTKRDVADLVLVWVALRFIIIFIGQLVTVGTLLFAQEGPYGKFTNKALAVPLQIFYVVVLLVGAWILLFKRKAILDLLFPDSDAKIVKLSAEAHLLTDYSFWIKLLGLWIAISSAITFISKGMIQIGFKREFVPTQFSWAENGHYLVATILALLVIWKSKQIAAWVEKIGSSKKQTHTINDEQDTPPSAD